MKDKRGSKMLNNETIGLILAVVFILLIAYSFFTYLGFSGYSYTDETLNSYDKTLEKTASDLERHGVSDFSVFPSTDSSQVFFLVYFGNRQAIEDALAYYEETTATDYLITHIRTDFFLRNKASNTLCICHVDINKKKYIKRQTRDDGILREDLYTASSSCTKCHNFEWPLEVRSQTKPEVFDISEHVFSFAKEKDEAQKTIYTLNVTDI